MDWPPKMPQNSPLTLCARGYMARIAGRPRWIAGKVPHGDALAAYHRKASALLRGAKPLAVTAPAAAPAATTVHWLLGKYLLDRKADMERGELAAEGFDQIRRSCQRVDAILADHRTDAVNPSVFRALYDRLSTDHGTDAAKRAVGHFATACRHAMDHEWVGPMRLGKVGKLTGRSATTSPRWRLFTAGDLAKILREIDRRIALTGGDGRAGHAWHQLKAGVLLALNGGYGSKECSDLTVGEVDVARGIIDHARGKTGKQHLVPLWAETIAALTPILSLREKPDDLVFRNRGGRPWNYSEMRTVDGKLRKFSDDTAKARFNDVLTALGMKVWGQSFYKLKHTFSTSASKAKDSDALALLMGHGLPGSRGHYVRVGEDRLREVVDAVRHELLSEYLNHQATPQTKEGNGP